MKYHLVTLGCAKNTVDSMRLEQALRGGRHVAVAEPAEADLLLVNTCGFIDAAKDESVGVVRALGGSTALAWTLHGALAVAVFATVTIVWRKELPFDLKAAALSAHFADNLYVEIDAIAVVAG